MKPITTHQKNKLKAFVQDIMTYTNLGIEALGDKTEGEMMDFIRDRGINERDLLHQISVFGDGPETLDYIDGLTRNR